jgi:hypothetical protein
MTQVSSTFETGSDESNLATGDAGSPTAYDIVQITSPGTLKYDNSIAGYGSLAARVVSSTATSGIHFGWSTAMGSQSGTHYGRLYFYFTAYPTPSVAFVLYESSTPANAVRIRIKSATGNIEVLDSSNTVKATSSNVVNLSSWNRLEWKLVQGTGSSGSVECKLFLSPNSATADETFSTGGCNTLAASASVKFGLTGSNPQNWGTVWLDNVVAGATAYPGPAGGSLLLPNRSLVITRT